MYKRKYESNKYDWANHAWIQTGSGKKKKYVLIEKDRRYELLIYEGRSPDSIDLGITSFDWNKTLRELFDRGKLTGRALTDYKSVASFT